MGLIPSEDDGIIFRKGVELYHHSFDITIHSCYNC